MTPKDIKRGERNYLITVPFGTAPLMLWAYSGKSKQISAWLADTLTNVGFPISTSNASLIPLVAAVAFIFATIFFAQHKLLAKCPSCRKSFFPNNSGIVIATKNCPNCGAQVIHEASKP